jgi:hypothetical protein
MAAEPFAETAESIGQLRSQLCAAITKETARHIHSPHLLQLAKDGRGHFIVEMALYGDVLRVLNDADSLMERSSAEGKPDQDAFVIRLFKAYAKYRRDYLRQLSQPSSSPDGVLAFYRSDSKPFGYACESTRWAGLDICRRADLAQRSDRFENHYRTILRGLIDTISPRATFASAHGRLIASLDAASPSSTPLPVNRDSSASAGATSPGVRDLANARIASEAELYTELMEIPAVRELTSNLAHVRRLSDARCEMLKNGVRVTPRILPKVMATVERIRRIIGDDTPCEAYVSSGADINAFVTVQDDVALIGLSSAAVHRLNGPGELEFVLGHELGHVLFDHAKVGAGMLLQSGRLSIREAMRVRAWERAAEISADRVGLLASGSLPSAITAFFKLRSGLTLGEHAFDLHEYCNQWDELAAEITALGQRDLWDCSHPVAPLRVKAMAMYWNAVTQPPPDRDNSLREVDASVQRMLAMMDPSEICERTTGSDAILAPFYFWGGLYVAMADGDLSEVERARVRALAPPGFDIATSFEMARTDPQRCLSQFKGDLEARRRKLSAIELYRIMSGVLDVACADHQLTDGERARLHEIGEAVGLHDVACDLVIKRYLSESETTA